jgi:glucokinase
VRELEAEIEGSLVFKLCEGRPEEASAEVLFRSTRLGDELASRFMEEIGRLNAVGLSNVINSLEPSLIVIGGGVALNNFDLILKYSMRYIKEYVYNELPEFRPASFGEDEVLYGAIALALRPPEGVRPL